MKYLVESFREFLDLAKINQGPDGWRIYGSNPKKKKDINLKKVGSKLKEIKKD